MRIVTGIVTILLFAQTAASVWDGIYTIPQADRGKALYATECASCHGMELGGAGQAPPLAGPEFLKGWDGQTVGDLFEKMQATMPADAPGRLKNKQNADILAFILQSNQFPAGEVELVGDAAFLNSIRFEATRGGK